MVPAKANVEQQDQFRCQELEPRIAQGRPTYPFFVDAALSTVFGFPMVICSVVHQSTDRTTTIQCFGCLH